MGYGPRRLSMRASAAAVVLFFCAAAISSGALGCGTILGIKTFLEEGDAATVEVPADAQPRVIDGASGFTSPDAGTSPDDDASSSSEGGSEADASDAGLGPEISAPPPPPAIGRPGMDLTAGGNVSTSSLYTLIATVGEAPGGNVVSTSSMYTLQGGLVATPP